MNSEQNKTNETAHECNHDCSNCNQDCHDPKSFIEKPHALSCVRKVIGIVSGKGGVGKSMVSSLLASQLQKNGYHSAILDADITGPSIPQAFGITERATGDKTGMYPVMTSSGIQTMSINLILEHATDPVIWRGPVIANTVKQFWTDVIWHDVDYMIVDMPPGTGDVPLTVFQSIPVDGIIIVTSPQELVSMIVGKAVNMAKMMNIPILGIIENMSYISCPHCGEKISVFGKSHVDQVAQAHGIPVLGRLPIEPQIASAADQGKIETIDASAWFKDTISAL
jgi:Mrp family chromosome partitioning ATPase